MTTTTTATSPLLPVGAERADDWQPEGYRVISTADRPIHGTDLAVYGRAVQYVDGSIDEQTVCISADCPAELTPAQARELALELVAVTGVIGGWAE